MDVRPVPRPRPLSAVTGFLALFVLAGCSKTPDAKDPHDGASGPPWNVLLLSIDTLRADRLSAYGYERETSPNLDAFAARAVRFERCIAESPWTLPSHMSMLTGLYPTTHGVTTPAHAPGAGTRLLAQHLSAAGWHAFGLTDGGWMNADRGFARGFDSFADDGSGLASTLERTLAAIRSAPAERPWFAFLHTYDVHCPYDPPEPYASRFQTPGRSPIEVADRCGNPDFNALDLSPAEVATLSDHYDGGIRYVDDLLGPFFDDLRTRGVLDRTLVIITSDHGEEFYEHGQIGHERSLHAELLHVPLLIAGPGIAPAVSPTPTGLVDIVPTILDLLAIAPADLASGSGLDGRSLASELLTGQPDPASPYRFSELGWQTAKRSLLSPDVHLIQDVLSGKSQLFDRAADPLSQRDVAAEQPDLAQQLGDDLRRLHRALSAKKAAVETGRPLSERHRAELRRLGYAGD